MKAISTALEPGSHLIRLVPSGMEGGPFDCSLVAVPRGGHWYLEGLCGEKFGAGHMRAIREWCSERGIQRVVYVRKVGGSERLVERHL